MTRWAPVNITVRTLKKPEIKGGAVDGIIVGPSRVEDITKLPSREALIARVVSLALSIYLAILTNHSVAAWLGEQWHDVNPAVNRIAAFLE